MHALVALLLTLVTAPAPSATAASPAAPATVAPASAVPAFVGRVAAVPPEVAARMRKSSWREGCPVLIDQLSYLTLSYWGYDGAVHVGELIVHGGVANEVVEVFEKLYGARFAIEKMRLIDEYGGNDDASMADNNTSGFNCRDVAGRPGVFSKHSYGRAIDINPLTNPFVTKQGVMPPGGAAFLDRTKKLPGLIAEGDVVFTAFVSHGWAWGGAWKSMKDYQHFEKSAAKPPQAP